MFEGPASQGGAGPNRRVPPPLPGRSTSPRSHTESLDSARTNSWVFVCICKWCNIIIWMFWVVRFIFLLFFFIILCQYPRTSEASKRAQMNFKFLSMAWWASAGRTGRDRCAVRSCSHVRVVPGRTVVHITGSLWKSKIIKTRTKQRMLKTVPWFKPCAKAAIVYCGPHSGPPCTAGGASSDAESWAPHLEVRICQCG